MTAIVPSVTALVLPADVELLPDNDQYTNRFDFVSGSGNKYRIAQSISGRWWSCSCPSWKFNQNGKRLCKHMVELGIPGGYQPFEVGSLAVGGGSTPAVGAASGKKPIPAPKVPALPAAAPPKGSVKPVSVEMQGDKIVVTFESKDAAAVFAMLAGMA